MAGGLWEIYRGPALPLLAGVLGLVVGSFLNVVIARVPAGLSVVSPGSRCPHCGHVLAWYENIPLLSWLVLRARCRQCKAPISARYPAVELLVGLLFAACAVRFGPGWELVRALLMVGFLVPLAFIDLEHWLLPYSLTLPGAATGLLSAIPLGLEAVTASVIGAAATHLLRCPTWAAPVTNSVSSPGPGPPAAGVGASKRAECLGSWTVRPMERCLQSTPRRAGIPPTRFLNPQGVNCT